MRAATAHCGSVDELWETLVARELLPARVLDSPQRRFIAGISQSERVPRRMLSGFLADVRAQGHLVYLSSKGDPSVCAWHVLAARPATIAEALAFAASFVDAERAEAICAEQLAPTLRGFATEAPTFVWTFPDPRMMSAWRTEEQFGPTMASLPYNAIASVSVARDEALMNLGFVLSAVLEPAALVLVMPTLGAGALES
jgi:hypothetical protein